MKIQILALIGLMLISCQKLTPGGTPYEREVIKKSLGIIKLQRGTCFGFCPVYKVEITSLGEVTFEGIAHTSTIGSASKTVAPEVYQAIVDRMFDAKYFEMENNYVKETVTDQSTVISSIESKGMKKSIIHYLGDTTAPLALPLLEDQIDELLGTQEWIRK